MRIKDAYYSLKNKVTEVRYNYLEATQPGRYSLYHPVEVESGVRVVGDARILKKGGDLRQTHIINLDAIERQRQKR